MTRILVESERVIQLEIQRSLEYYRNDWRHMRAGFLTSIR